MAAVVFTQTHTHTRWHSTLRKRVAWIKYSFEILAKREAKQQAREKARKASEKPIIQQINKINDTNRMGRAQCKAQNRERVRCLFMTVIFR